VITFIYTSTFPFSLWFSHCHYFSRFEYVPVAATLSDVQEAQPEQLTATEAETQAQAYLLQRKERKIYQDTELHLVIIQTIFSLMLNQQYVSSLSSSGDLSTHVPQRPSGPPLLGSVSDQQQEAQHSLPPLYAYALSSSPSLSDICLVRNTAADLNHPANASLIPLLCARAEDMGPGPLRLLKLTATRLFQPSLYRGVPSNYRSLPPTNAPRWPSPPFHLNVMSTDARQI
jgi:hypothetical protein